MLSRNGKLDPIWTRAQNGNVALIGEIDFTQADEVTLALGFGQHPEEAAQWSTDGWRTTHDDPTRDTGLGVHVVDVAAATLAPGTTIQFTLFWTQHQRWEGTDFSVEVVARK
jgi:Glucodextranase, domain N